MSKSSSQSAADAETALIKQLSAALEFQKNGDMDEAEKIYKEAVRQNPNNPDVLHMAAIFYNQAGKYPYALTLLKKVISYKPNDAATNKAMGKALYEMEKYPEAKICLEKALAQDIDDPEANELMGFSLHKMANLKGAENFYRRALQHRESIEARNRLAEILLFERRPKEAAAILKEMLDKDIGDYDSLIRYAVATGENAQNSLQAITMAIKTDPKREEAKSMLGLTLATGTLPDHTDLELIAIVSLCLQSQYVDHSELRALWHNQFFGNQENSKAEILLLTKDYEFFVATFEKEEFRRALLKPFFINGLNKITAFTERLENLLTFARRYYLEIFFSKKRDLENYEIQFSQALAIQSFFNEFIFNETKDEANKIEQLRKQIEVASDINDMAINAILFSCYRPLSDIKNAALSSENLPEILKSVFEIHINEPRIEQKIKKSIPSMGKIEDKTSREVQAQYEENPYPRWQSANFLKSFFTTFIAEKYKRRDKILIAGCGTGKHILSLYSNYAHMELTVIDLSSSSLAYAMRKCEGHGLKNIKFYQGDILEADRLKEKYDFIECAGVLHHMHDPAQGLDVLVGLLTSHGEIRLGLYSELARRDVVRIRKIIAEKGFKSDLEGIRACREYIKGTPESEFSFIRNSIDFFSASTCRDFMFHVQEIRYTIPQLKELLDNAGLQFGKFILTPSQFGQYCKNYPDDSNGYNLDNWDEFEQNNPGFFGAMYQFTAKRK